LTVLSNGLTQSSFATTDTNGTRGSRTSQDPVVRAVAAKENKLREIHIHIEDEEER
jgi:hypothetical protein